MKPTFALILLLLLAASLRAAEPAAPPIRVGALPLLLADDAGIAASEGVSRTVHLARRLDAPVLVPDRPWEERRLYLYGSVYADASGGHRMWYMAHAMSPLQTRPALPHGGRNPVLLATSADGLIWNKSDVGLFELDGSRANNIVFDLHSPSVLVDPFETDPNRRYKMLGSYSGGYYAAYSADGVRWTSASAKPVLARSDTITLAQHPVTGEYLAYHKRPTTIRGIENRRVVWLARSRDFREWSQPELVFAPDEEDETWATEPEQRMDVYNMSVYSHAAGFLGLPAMFRVTKIRPKSEVTAGQSGHDGPLDVQLVTSADGVHWQRTSPRVNIIPRGEAGTYDGGAILGVSSTPIHTSEHTWVYYTAMNTTHGAPLSEKRFTIGRAEWRRHGFVSLDAGEMQARVETRPLQFTSPELVINADASGGELRVALVEQDGTPIEGYALADSAVLTADTTRWPARWKARSDIPTDRPVRVMIEMTGARLYSLQ